MKKIVGVGFMALVVMTALNPTASAQTTSSATTIEELQKQVQQLLSQIQALQKEVTDLKTETGLQAPTTNLVASETTAVADESAPTLPELTRSLSLGTRGDDVRKLQEFLARDKEIYPEGLTTGFFGPKTAEAVKRWQRKNNVEVVGIVGPKTIARFRELGQGVVQGLMQEGAGKSGVRPPGLDMAPGVQRQMASTTPTVMPPMIATATPPILPSATTTPAVPAIPAIPAVPGVTSAVPATPAVPAQPTATTTSDTIPPSAPTNLSAVALLSTQINLAWASSTDNVGIAGYKIYRNGTYITSATFTTYANQNLTPATAYTYTVAAYDVAGNVSAQSLSVTATTPAAPTTPAADTTAPSTPTGLSATPVITSQINLGWAASQDNVSVKGYKLYRNGVLVPSTGSLIALNYSDTGLSTGTSYSYTISAYDDAGNESAQSSPVTTTTQAIVAAPTAPTNLTVVSSGGRWNLNWTDNATTETVYAPYFRSAGTTSWMWMSTLSANATSYGDVTATGAYEFRVYACTSFSRFFDPDTQSSCAGSNVASISSTQSSTATTTATTILNPSLASIIETLNEILQKVKVLIK